VRLPAAQRVPGDLILQDEGERVSAHGVVRDADAIAVADSPLTGESVPVRQVALVIAARPLQHRRPARTGPLSSPAPWSCGATPWPRLSP